MTQEQANWEWIDARVKRLEEHCFNPAKELTEDELAVLTASVPIRPSYEDLIHFARAILRKAQEK